MSHLFEGDRHSASLAHGYNESTDRAMLRPSFSIVTFVLAALCLFGMFTVAIRRFIPAGEPNDLVHSSEPYLAAGAYQPVRWRELTHETMRLAKQLKKPIFLVIGTTASANGRLCDRLFFSDRQVAALLNSGFVCVRVDVMEHPAMATAYLPLHAVGMGPIDFPECWVLSPDGEVGANMITSDMRTPTQFAVAVSDAHGRVQTIRPGLGAIGVDHFADVQALVNPSPTPPDFTRELAELRPDGRSFGTIGARRYVWPSALETLTASGRATAARDAASQWVLSPQCDWVDGGFYHLMMTGSQPRVEFDKFAVENAEMMTALLRISIINPDRMLADTAQRTMRFLIDRLASYEMVSAVQVGDERRDGRSDSASVSPPRLRRIIDANRDDVQKWLTLSPQRNVQFLPFVSKRDDYIAFSRQIGDAVERLRTARTKSAPISNHRLAWVNGSVLARLLEYLRLSNDTYGRRMARSLTASLENIRDDQEILCRTYSVDSGATDFYSYLAYSDAMLQSYLANGDYAVLDKGLRVLIRAAMEFDTGARGVYAMQRIGTAAAPRTENPEVIDRLHVSATAKAIRLFTDYGRLFADAAVGKDLVRRAAQSVNAFGGLITPSIQTAGYFGASMYHMDDRYALAVGPDAVRQATLLARLRPTRLVAPVVGQVRGDLRKAVPGIYVVSSGKTEGPFSVEAAAVKLPLEVIPAGGP